MGDNLGLQTQSLLPKCFTQSLWEGLRICNLQTKSGYLLTAYRPNAMGGAQADACGIATRTPTPLQHLGKNEMHLLCFSAKAQQHTSALVLKRN